MSSLGLHIGMGASRILAGHVGGVENRREFFITGEACEEMNRSEKDANNMEIVFSKSVGEWIRQFKGVSECAGGAMSLASRVGALSVIAGNHNVRPIITCLLGSKCVTFGKPHAAVINNDSDLCVDLIEACTTLYLFQLNGGAAELATVRLESGNERLVFFDCPSSALPDVIPAAIVRNDAMCNILKVSGLCTVAVIYT